MSGAKKEGGAGLADGSHESFRTVTTANASSYWGAVDATLDGVLGGYAVISTPDADSSLAFAGNVLGGRELARALDCGAGIGRVTRDVLSKLARKVDLVELIPKYVEQARIELKDEPRMGEFFVSSLQDCTPEPGAYDLVWIQWVIGHLTDAELVAFLRRCAAGLAHGGWIMVKDNNVSPQEPGLVDGCYLLDDDDHSVMRTNKLVKSLFAAAGLELRKETRQTRFPSELCTVRMYALQPAASA
jgi:protein N-terminal methyltransferase